MRRTLLWVSRNRWLAHRLPRYRFARAAVTRFMPGEELDAAVAATRSLSGHRIATVLTRLGENVTEAAEAEAVASHYDDVLDRIAAERLPAQISIKLTQLGLDIGRETAAAHLEQLAARAAPGGGVVWVDMEGSAYTDATLELYRRVLGRHANVGLCLQAYLRRTERDLASLLPLTHAIRLVKGAYDEPREIAYASRAEVDRAYLRLAEMMLEAAAAGPPQRMPSGPPAFGTHDTALIGRIAAAAEARGVAPDAYEVQMLYGIRSGEQRRLSAEGHAVRVLISYGPEWFPWFVRRLAERPANLWFVVRNLVPG